MYKSSIITFGFVLGSLLMLSAIPFFNLNIFPEQAFFGSIPEDYFDPRNYGQETSFGEQLQKNNSFDQGSLPIIADYKYGESINTSPEIYSNSINFIAAGDWNCNEETEKTIMKMTTLKPELVLGLGDYTFKNVSPHCWFEVSKPIDHLMKIAIGNHDLDYQSSYHQLLDHYNLSEPYYSFNFQNIHFLVLSSEHPFEEGSRQYEFVRNDLDESLQDPSIVWRIVFLHKPMYTSAKFDEKDSEELKNTFHGLFERDRVDIVLSGHTQYYQRSLPLLYNNDNPNYPIGLDHNKNKYINNDGVIFVTVGTAGDELHKIAYSLPYYVIQQGQFGFLNFELTNSAQTLVGTFYDTDDSNILDQFVISKDNTEKKTFSDNNSGRFNNNYYLASYPFL